jgi:flagellar biosynthetic protein FliP
LSLSLDSPETARALQSIQTVAIFAGASLVPIAILMLTSFVRINIVLILLRQALGSPQVPGNQVLMALALLLTLLVMQPVGEQVYEQAIAPVVARKISVSEAWESGVRPVKAFMVDQIVRTHHQKYLWTFYDYTEPAGADGDKPKDAESFPLRVVAPAFLLSEITTAMLMGFYLYLPFLVIDLVVSSVLAATGLFMLPPALVAMPVKLIVFVLADGWLLVSSMLLKSFAIGSAHP